MRKKSILFLIIFKIDHFIMESWSVKDYSTKKQYSLECIQKKENPKTWLLNQSRRFNNKKASIKDFKVTQNGYDLANQN